MGVALLAIRTIWAVLTGTVVTAWRSIVRGVTRTPDGGTGIGPAPGFASHGDLWVKVFRSDYIVNFLSLIGIQGLSPFA